MTIALVIGLWFVLAAPRSLGGPVSIVWVSGTSMEPTLYSGDISLLYNRSSYDVGDIVAFEIPEGGTVIHRVEHVVGDGYKFKGDNREGADPWTLSEADIRGRQIARIPNFQAVLVLLGRPEVMALLVAGFVVLLRLKRDESINDDDEAASPGLRLPALPWR